MIINVKRFQGFDGQMASRYPRIGWKLPGLGLVSDDFSVEDGVSAFFVEPSFDEIVLEAGPVLLLSSLSLLLLSRLSRL